MKTGWIVLSGLLLGACGTPLLGGECAPGYAADGAVCTPVADASTSSGSSSDPGSSSTTGSSSSGESSSGGGSSVGSTSGAGGAACGEGQTTCDGVCVDLSSDPSHCGDCAKACAGAACISSVCKVPALAPSGQAILVGMDFATVLPGDPMAMLLGNAVFASVHDPVRVLDYRALAQWNASTVTNTVDLIADEAVARGRKLQTAVAPDGALVPGLLATHAYDVLFIHDLDAAPAGVLGPLGQSWSGALETFASGGGVVVIVATTGGVSEMPAFLAGAGLFLTTSAASAAGKPLSVTTDDTIGAGLAASLPAVKGTTSFLLGAGGPDAWRVIATDELAPVVLHRVWASP